MPTIYLSIELNGAIVPKRCEHFRTPEGFTDYGAIRRHFENQGFSVGSIKIN